MCDDFVAMATVDVIRLCFVVDILYDGVRRHCSLLGWAFFSYLTQIYGCT